MSIPTDEHGRPVLYILQDAQHELMLSLAWRISKHLLPKRLFRRTKLALANWVLAEAMVAVQPGWSPEQPEEQR